ncbi:hypothetical protein UlMin_026713 [Ulmus minor]
MAASLFMPSPTSSTSSCSSLSWFSSLSRFSNKVGFSNESRSGIYAPNGIQICEWEAIHVLNERTLPNFLESTLVENTGSRINNKIKLFSGTANPALSQEIAWYMGLELGKIDIKRFADGEIYVQLQESVRGCDVFLLQPTCPPVNENLMELEVMIEACWRASAKNITAVTPYFGYAQADRKLFVLAVFLFVLYLYLVYKLMLNTVLAKGKARQLMLSSILVWKVVHDFVYKSIFHDSIYKSAGCNDFWHLVSEPLVVEKKSLDMSIACVEYYFYLSSYSDQCFQMHQALLGKIVFMVLHYASGFYTMKKPLGAKRIGKTGGLGSHKLTSKVGYFVVYDQATEIYHCALLLSRLGSGLAGCLGHLMAFPMFFTMATTFTGSTLRLYSDNWERSTGAVEQSSDLAL